MCSPRDWAQYYNSDKLPLLINVSCLFVELWSLTAAYLSVSLGEELLCFELVCGLASK